MRGIAVVFSGSSRQLNEILGKATQLNWSGEMQRVATQIAAYVSMDTKKPYSNDDVTMYQQQVGYFMTGRRNTSPSTWWPPRAPRRPARREARARVSGDGFAGAKLFAGGAGPSQGPSTLA